MRKPITVIHILLAAAVYSSTLQASGGDGKKHGKRHHKPQHTHVESTRYYPPQPQYPVTQDRRSTQGLAGGVVGGVVGYEIGNGNPLATGIGAAAGAYLGNEIADHK
ncbi:MAG: glycine zipper 2TM domain-containing protein [Gammaproteobacteria bacterium]